jgi:hypothetical protein
MMLGWGQAAADEARGAVPNGQHGPPLLTEQWYGFRAGLPLRRVGGLAGSTQERSARHEAVKLKRVRQTKLRGESWSPPGGSWC